MVRAQPCTRTWCSCRWRLSTWRAGVRLLCGRVLPGATREHWLVWQPLSGVGVVTGLPVAGGTAGRRS